MTPPSAPDGLRRDTSVSMGKFLTLWRYRDINSHGGILLFDLRQERVAPIYSYGQKNRRRRGMFSGSRHWLEYDRVALAMLVIGIGVLALIIFTI
jgi:hypothetical protein